MTAEPRPADSFDPLKNVSDRDATVLEDLFLLGYTHSNVYTIYKDAKYEIRVQFRTLLPYETRDIANIVYAQPSPLGQLITEKLETLARAITSINGSPLVLSTQEREAYREKNRREASALDQARIILVEKVKSDHVLDAMWEAYISFVSGVAKQFEDVKKNLMATSSSVST